METQRLTRRQVLVSGVVGMAGLMAPREPLRAGSPQTPPAAAAGTLQIGGGLVVNRMGFGAMRITRPGIWGEPKGVAEGRRGVRRGGGALVRVIRTAEAHGT